MDMPNIGDRVWYVLPAGDFRPAIIVHAHSEGVVDLVVFGRPSDGDEYATGTAPKQRVPRYDKKPDDDYPTSGTWFIPQGQWLPHQ